MDAIVVTPICPMSLSSRPIVLPPGSVVSVWPLADPDVTTKLWTDGVMATGIWPGQRVDIRMADCLAQFIVLSKDYSYYQQIAVGRRPHSLQQQPPQLERGHDPKARQKIPSTLIYRRH